ncbi:uncharacterized protein LOC125230652 isoform X2 [Leguminivora glycinivorella]|uniref:uncharacterized protein LOC125230652 isoform X1 n=1 Tax=Leguminivora glycinivorella TaxID=1035111 RepID=UPI00200F72A1|nr:uncharacterized protein LOC125230652 isoform X1 [Leguminivora glycinivorella]XP_047991838.1 uncharacterized protein LOC125230652 isoform X2 [Leguminivora glycinivorella]
MLEHILVTAMIVGTLALMVHIWVCLMRFFQYYLDTLIRDSPNVLLEMTTAGLLGSSQKELAALGPLTRFLRQQQPQIHITLCWLLALCYADYIRKHYCTRFNLPYLEQWQEELHAMAGRRAHDALSAAHSFAAVVRSRLRSLAPQPPTNEAHTVSRTRAPGLPSAAAARRWRAAAEPARWRCACMTPGQSSPVTNCRSFERTSRRRVVRAPAPLAALDALSLRCPRHPGPRPKRSRAQVYGPPQLSPSQKSLLYVGGATRGNMHARTKVYEHNQPRRCLHNLRSDVCYMEQKSLKQRRNNIIIITKVCPIYLQPRRFCSIYRTEIVARVYQGFTGETR